MQLALGASSHVHTAGPPPGPPPITFRHLLSAGSLHPANPLRVIAHCDVDAAYAAFEAKRLGIDPHKTPIAVQQWNGLIAISYAARKFGITRHETIEDARKKCPDLIFAHVATYAEGADHAEYNEDPRPETHKVSLDPYRRESKKILEIFKKTCPAGAVEKASIDESFFDLTIEVRKALLEEFPELRAPPEDSSAGLDTPLPEPPQDAQRLWAGLGHLIPIEGDVGEGQDVNTETKKAMALKAQARAAGRLNGEGKVILPKGSRTMAPSADMGPSSAKLIEAAKAAEVASLTSGALGDSAEMETMDDEAESGDEDFVPPSAQMDPAARRLQEEENGREAQEQAAASKKLTAEEETKGILEVEDVAITWQDIALAVGAKLMAKVRTAVKDELGYTTSAGVASNKTMAKLCSGWRKPNAQTIMRPAAVRNFLKVLPFQKIRFLGGKLGDAMANEWQSATVGDLWDVTLEQMQAKFGEDSGWVYNVLRGIDHSEVKERVANKTMLASKNVRPVITTWAHGQHWLSILSTELAVRLAEERESEPNLWPRTIVLRYLRIGDTGRSRQAAFPFARDLNASVVRKAAEKLWRDAFGDLAKPSGNASPSKGGGAGTACSEWDGKEIRPGIVTIALGFSGLEKAAESGQRRLDQSFFVKGATQAGPSSSLKRSQTVSHSSDGLDVGNASAGDRIDDEAEGATISGTDPVDNPARKRRRQEDAGETGTTFPQQHDTKELASSTLHLGKVSSPNGVASHDAVRPAHSKRKSTPSWTCPQCGETLQPPIEALLLPMESDDAEFSSVLPQRKAPWPFDEDDAEAAELAAPSEMPQETADAAVAGAAAGHFSEEEAQAWLQAARTAHEDEHFARQLQEEENRRNRALAGSQAYAAARAAAAAGGASSSSSQRPAKGKGSSKGGSGAGGGSSSTGSAAKGKGSKPRGSGNIASFFSQQPRNP